MDAADASSLGSAGDRPDTTSRRRVPQRRRGNGAQTRSKILASARHLADTRAVPEITVEDIAAGADVSRAAVYMYFENRLAICHEVAQSTQAVFLEVATTIERLPTLRETIELGVRSYITGHRNDRPGMRMMYELSYAEQSIRDLVHELRSQVYRAWEVEFAEAVKAGQCPEFDVPVVTRLLVGMLETFCVRTMRTKEYRATSAVKGGDSAAVISELWCRALQLPQ